MTRTTALLAGAILFTLPFQMYLFGGSHHGGRTESHGDHDARHGGTLVMVEDHHLEIVEADRRVEIYVTDALRRPVQPSGGTVVFDDGAQVPLTWSTYRLTAEAPAQFAWADYSVTLGDGTVLVIGVPRSGGSAATPPAVAASTSSL